MRIPFAFYLVIIVFSVSCNNHTDKSVNVKRPGKNELVDLNKYFVQKDRERILNYIERKNLSMKESATGLWYCILKEGKGRYFKDNDKISFNYVCSLLDGTECYNSDKLGPKEFILGKSEIETGLNEGIRLLKPGGEAIFILPPFMAYGLLGDGKSIPPRSVLIYSVKINNGD